MTRHLVDLTAFAKSQRTALYVLVRQVTSVHHRLADQNVSSVQNVQWIKPVSNRNVKILATAVVELTLDAKSSNTTRFVAVPHLSLEIHLFSALKKVI